MATTLENIETLNGSAHDMARAYLDATRDAQPGTYVYLSVNPRTGDWWTGNEVSRCVSCDEYFQKHGPESVTTILSGRVPSETPDGDDLDLLYDLIERIEQSLSSIEDGLVD